MWLPVIHRLLVLIYYSVAILQNWHIVCQIGSFGVMLQNISDFFSSSERLCSSKELLCNTHALVILRSDGVRARALGVDGADRFPGLYANW